MKHHKLISRTPQLAQGHDPFVPGLTALQSKLNFMVAMFERLIDFTFTKTM